ncbi:MAG: hypothetical protein DRO92_03060 [Candidatus Altiarchaeales archaeon]|nr:MAG: hypothetical protein DRO92_03060 [Candidatus Altiarchaeales archaeon]
MASSNGKNLEELLSEERTLLSKERTSLSYIRTGITLVAVGLGMLKLFETNNLVFITGSITVLIGFLMVIYHAMWDRRYVQRIRYFENKIHKLTDEEKITDNSLKN